MKAPPPIYVTAEQLPTDAQLEKIHEELDHLCRFGRIRGIMARDESLPRKRRQVPRVRDKVR